MQQASKEPTDAIREHFGLPTQDNDSDMQDVEHQGEDQVMEESEPKEDLKVLRKRVAELEDYNKNLISNLQGYREHIEVENEKTLLRNLQTKYTHVLRQFAGPDLMPLETILLSNVTADSEYWKLPEFASLQKRFFEYIERQLAESLDNHKLFEWFYEMCGLADRSIVLSNLQVITTILNSQYEEYYKDNNQQRRNETAKKLYSRGLGDYDPYFADELNKEVTQTRTERPGVFESWKKWKNFEKVVENIINSAKTGLSGSQRTFAVSVLVLQKKNRQLFKSAMRGSIRKVHVADPRIDYYQEWFPRAKQYFEDRALALRQRNGGPPQPPPPPGGPPPPPDPKNNGGNDDGPPPPPSPGDPKDGDQPPPPSSSSGGGAEGGKQEENTSTDSKTSGGQGASQTGATNQDPKSTVAIDGIDVEGSMQSPEDDNAFQSMLLTQAQGLSPLHSPQQSHASSCNFSPYSQGEPQSFIDISKPVLGRYGGRDDDDDSSKSGNETVSQQGKNQAPNVLTMEENELRVAEEKRKLREELEKQAKEQQEEEAKEQQEKEAKGVEKKPEALSTLAEAADQKAPVDSKDELTRQGSKRTLSASESETKSTSEPPQKKGPSTASKDDKALKSASLQAQCNEKPKADPRRSTRLADGTPKKDAIPKKRPGEEEDTEEARRKKRPNIKKMATKGKTGASIKGGKPGGGTKSGKPGGSKKGGGKAPPASKNLAS